MHENEHVLGCCKKACAKFAYECNLRRTVFLKIDSELVRSFCYKDTWRRLTMVFCVETEEGLETRMMGFTCPPTGTPRGITSTSTWKHTFKNLLTVAQLPKRPPEQVRSPSSNINSIHSPSSTLNCRWNQLFPVTNCCAHNKIFYLKRLN